MSNWNQATDDNLPIQGNWQSVSVSQDGHVMAGCQGDGSLWFSTNSGVSWNQATFNGGVVTGDWSVSVSQDGQVKEILKFGNTYLELIGFSKIPETNELHYDFVNDENCYTLVVAKQDKKH